MEIITKWGHAATCKHKQLNKPCEGEGNSGMGHVQWQHIEAKIIIFGFGVHYTFIFISCYCLSFLALFLVRLVVKCICFPSSSPPTAHSDMVTDTCQFPQRAPGTCEGLQWGWPGNPSLPLTVTVILDNVLNLSESMFSNISHFQELCWRINEMYTKYIGWCLACNRCSVESAPCNL